MHYTMRHNGKIVTFQEKELVDAALRIQSPAAQVLDKNGYHVADNDKSEQEILAECFVIERGILQ